jgi:hypothetical protein
MRHFSSLRRSEIDLTVPIMQSLHVLNPDTSGLYPPDLVEETLRTLALLFPQSEYGNTHRAVKVRKNWLSNISRDGLDPKMTQCGTLQTQDRQFDNFAFWHDRLVILKMAYDDADPKSLPQWWHDRRDGERWYGFWIAIMVLAVTAILSLVQVIEAAVQISLARSQRA